MLKRFFTKRMRILLAAALILALVVTLGAALRQGHATGENVVTTLLTPLRRAVAAFDRQAERIYDYLFRYDTLEAENEALKKQLGEQTEAIRSAEAQQRENQRLRELLKLSEEHPDYRFTAAYVIGWNISPWESSITIDRGSADGLCKGMCAVTGDRQVIGLVTQVGRNWASIATIYDSSSQISAAIGSSGNTGVVQGDRDENGEGCLKMRYLSSNAVLRNGDSVVTTGSTLYPRGLLLGTITDAGLEENGVSKFAVIHSSFRPDGLEQVFLLTSYDKN